MYQNQRSEEGGSHCGQTSRHGPDPPGSSPTSHSESDDWGAEGQKTPQGKGEKSNQGKEPEVTRKGKKRNDRESSSPEQSQDTHGGSNTKTSMSHRPDWKWTEDGKSNTANQTPSSWNTEPPGVVPPQSDLFPGRREQNEDGMSKTAIQTPSSFNNKPPGVVPPQEQKSKHLKIFYDISNVSNVEPKRWLIGELKKDSIPEYEVNCCDTSHSLEELKVEAEKCSLVILCLSYESRCEGNVKKFLEWCRKPVIGVITGLENISSEKEKREYWENVSKDLKSSKFDLITLTKQDEKIIKTNNSETRVRLDTKMKDMKDILQNSAANITVLSPLQKPKVDIGIFSRSDESDYSWLVELLRSGYFSDRVPGVTPCYISNSGRQKFREDASKCKLGILYHTKNRGRINVTDVTDALYNEELRHLTEKLGKDNVIVVIDDLEDSSDIEKKRILESQKSIEKLAQGLFLFSHDEKLIASAETKMKQLRAMIAGYKDLNPEDLPSPRTS